MLSGFVHCLLGIVGGLGLEPHLHRFGFATVHKLILHIDGGIAVVAKADGEHFLHHGDVGLPHGHQLVAIHVIHAVIGLHGYGCKCQYGHRSKLKHFSIHLYLFVFGFKLQI